jgi:hypothetical protein
VYSRRAVNAWSLVQAGLRGERLIVGGHAAIGWGAARNPEGQKTQMPLLPRIYRPATTPLLALISETVKIQGAVTPQTRRPLRDDWSTAGALGSYG